MSDRPDWADHRVTVDATDYDGGVDYHLVTGERIEPVGDAGEGANEGAFGHADGTNTDGRDEYYCAGRLLSVKLRPSLVELGIRETEAAPIAVRVDGEQIDFERWDPSRGDLRVGYGGVGALPADLSVSVADCDRIVSSRGELVDAASAVEDGDRLGIDADIDLPEGEDSTIAFDQDDLTVVGLETDAGTHPTLSKDRCPEGWGHTALSFSGDRTAVIGLQFRGPLDRYVEDRDSIGKATGLSFSGHDQVALNCRGYFWPHAAFAAGGEGETYVCVDAHHNMLGGLGYGIVAQGPVSYKDFDAGETWSDEELETARPWHRRAEIERARFDANRHDVAGGTNTSYELRRFAIGPTSVKSTRIDMHRPGGGVIGIGDGIVDRPDRGIPADELVHGFWVRGRPVVGARLERVWFAWGEEPDPEHRHPERGLPIAQVCATEESWVTRAVWDREDGPFHGIEWNDCAFGPEEPPWLSDELRAAGDGLRHEFPDVLE